MGQPNPPFQSALLAGALAGSTVDLSLFPLDTLKTRLQSSQGFFASGGFRGIYRGIGSALVGSAPGAAFFFCTYEATKSFLSTRRWPLPLSGTPADGLNVPSPSSPALDHMIAASLGEIAACSVRVPTEVVKQRAQAGQHDGSSLSSIKAILALHRTVGVVGVWRELYRGWGITIFREVPFTVIQFPLWEALKAWGRERRERTGAGLFGEPAAAAAAAAVATRPRQGGDAAPPSVIIREVSAPESALYGSMAGAVAAGITTPLDVLKTRVMLSAQKESVPSIVRSILRDHGVRPFFAGIGPRVAWISAGGAIFLGSYQWAINMLSQGAAL